MAWLLGLLMSVGMILIGYRFRHVRGGPLTMWTGIAILAATAVLAVTTAYFSEEFFGVFYTS